jgi:hypothetical protein
VAHRIEQRPQQARTGELEFLPKFLLRPPLYLREGGQGQKEGAVGEIGTADDIFDAVEDDRAGGVEQHLVLVGVELADRKAS